MTACLHTEPSWGAAMLLLYYRLYLLATIHNNIFTIISFTTPDIYIYILLQTYDTWFQSVGDKPHEGNEARPHEMLHKMKCRMCKSETLEPESSV